MSETLNPNEPHPAIKSAIAYLSKMSEMELMQHREAFASCAIEGNRLAEICIGTINRLLKNEPVSDRYLLGLVWTLRDMKGKG